MPEQFAVHAKPGTPNVAIPFVVVVQSNRFRSSSQCVVVPLLDAVRFGQPASDIAPHFVVGQREVVLDPIRITNVPARALGEAIASLEGDDDRIINALDTLLSRAWR